MTLRLGILFAALSLAVDAHAQSAWGEPTTSQLPGEVGERDRSSGDGVYGRFDGDLDIGLGLGAEVDSNTARGGARASLHYFSMIGLYATYSDVLGRSDPAPERFVATGIDMRPAFVPRWSRDLQRGPGALDLALDSISLGLGVWWAEPRDGSLGDQRGFEGSLGMGVPLFGGANGLWIEARGMLRWPDPAHAPGESPEPVFVAMLSWHDIVLAFARTEN
jgi:hypothetical protein